VLALEILSAEDLTRVETIWRAWHARNRLIIGRSFSDDSALREYEPVAYSTGTEFTSSVRALRQNVQHLVGKLQVLEATLDLVTEDATLGTQVAEEVPGEEVFIVHGHSHRDSVALVVERAIGRQAIILQEQPDVGSITVIEKLEREARRAGYAVVPLPHVNTSGKAASLPHLKPPDADLG
jgi:hypothetical protein